MSTSKIFYSEHLGFRGRQDHYNASVEDFAIFQTADGRKVVQIEENPTNTRQGGFRFQTNQEVLPSKCGVKMVEKEILYDFSSSG